MNARWTIRPMNIKSDGFVLVRPNGESSLCYVGQKRAESYRDRLNAGEPEESVWASLPGRS